MVNVQAWTFLANTDFVSEGYVEPTEPQCARDSLATTLATTLARAVRHFMFTGIWHREDAIYQTKILCISPDQGHKVLAGGHQGTRR